MLTDSTGLGFTARNGEILVHYPLRTAASGSHKGDKSHADRDYAPGWPIGPVPAWYAIDPPNAITAERTQLWARLHADAEGV